MSDSTDQNLVDESVQDQPAPAGELLTGLFQEVEAAGIGVMDIDEYPGPEEEGGGIRFASLDDLDHFLNILTGNGLCEDVIQRICGDASPEWDYGLWVIGPDFDEVGDSPTIPVFTYQPVVTIPASDIPAVLERLRGYNKGPVGRRAK